MPRPAPDPVTDATDHALADIVVAAGGGDDAAWASLMARFNRQLEAIARAHGLNSYDAQDAAQTAWLRLLENIGRVHSPAAIGGWLSITARREAMRISRSNARERPTDDADLPLRGSDPGPESQLVAAEARAAVGRVVAGLPGRERTLLGMLMADPTPSYSDISDALGLPVGSIGPTRGRCLARLRGDPELAHMAA